MCSPVAEIVRKKRKKIIFCYGNAGGQYASSEWWLVSHVVNVLDSFDLLLSASRACVMTECLCLHSRDQKMGSFVRVAKEKEMASPSE